jgi:diguanylate cyclase (GGDEF)-like protein
MAFGAPHRRPAFPQFALINRRLALLEPWALALGGACQVLVVLLMLRTWELVPLGPAWNGLLLLALAIAAAPTVHWARLGRRARTDGGLAPAAAEQLRPLAPLLGTIVIVSYWWSRCALGALGLAVLVGPLGRLLALLPAAPQLPASALGFLALALGVLPGARRLRAVAAAGLAALALGSLTWLLARGVQIPLPEFLAPLDLPGTDGFSIASRECAALFLLAPSLSAFDGVLALSNGHQRRAGQSTRLLVGSLAGMALLVGVLIFRAPPSLLLVPGTAFDGVVGTLLIGAAGALALMLAHTSAERDIHAAWPGETGTEPLLRCWSARAATALAIFGFFILRDAVWLFAGAGLAYLICLCGIAAAAAPLGLRRPLGASRLPSLDTAATLLAASLSLLIALFGLQAFGVQATLIGLVMIYSGGLLHIAGRLGPGNLRRTGTPSSVHAKLLAGMLLILALNGAGFLIVHEVLASADHDLASLVGDIFTAIALLTVLVGLILPAMVVHALTQAAEAAEQLAHGAVAGLRDGIDALGRGELEQRPLKLGLERLETPFSDEIGRIAASINTLQEDVEQAARGLDSARENLRRSRADLFHQARYDSLTGLHNRRAFEEALGQVVADRRHSGQGHALLYLDLDQFKIVNDTCGHDAGDELLRQVSLLLSAQMRSDDILSRLGGDEFGVILANCSMDNAVRIGEAMLVAVRELTFGWKDRVFRVGVSIGAVHFLAGTTSLTEVMSAADTACYYAKEQGRNRLHAYSPDDDEINLRAGEMQWVSRIHEAMEQGRLCLYAQRIAPLDGNDDDCAHHELLLRMVDLQGELVPPMAFIPAAERFGVMPLLDRWVVRTAFERLGELLRQDQHGSVGSLAINLSGASITDETFLEYVKEQFRCSQVPHGRVWFEITETSAIANLKKAKRFIAELRGLGCRFGLDDFGAGMSSFGYLRQLEVDFLKIDGAFVKDMVDDPIDHAMVASINRIGQLMGLRTIAEFVEDPRSIAMLRELGVNMIQGNGVSAPIPFAHPSSVRGPGHVVTH